jgi:hypothetical protein
MGRALPDLQLELGQAATLTSALGSKKGWARFVSVCASPKTRRMCERSPLDKHRVPGEILAAAGLLGIS